jgi:xylulokinase
VTRLIGLDIGTSGCKAIVFSTDGAPLSSASREYPIDIPRPTWAEQNAELVWSRAREVLHEATAGAGPGEPIAAIGLSVQGEATIPVDARGQAMRPAILGMDYRTGEQNRWLAENMGAEYLFERTGMPLHTVNTLPKLLWLKEHAPDVWSRADRFMLYEDFLINKMTGTAAISRCLASRTQAYDLLDDRWSPHILAAIGLDPGRLAAVYPSGTAVGRMHAALAGKLGLAEPPLVVTGGHDQACGALGAGLTRPELAGVSTGTAEVVELAMATPALNDVLRQGNISVYAHVVPGLFLAMVLNQSGGLVLRWYRDTFCWAEVQQAEREGGSAYDLILADASPGPSPLIVLPHLSGSGTPWFDTASKGAILGLTFGTTRADVAKAILEGLTFELRVNLDLLKEGGVVINELRAIGGGARSDLWLQLKADILGVPVVAPAVTEAACLGAALLAGVGAGVYPDAVGAAASVFKPARIFQPDPERRVLYDRRYAVYRSVYPAVAPISYQL